MSRLEPYTEAETVDIVRAARADGTTVEILGGGTRRPLGRPIQAKRQISTAHMSGITLYEPAELVMSARAGTPVAEIEAALAESDQYLPFEPLDHRSLLGTEGTPTIGGVFASNASGPRRLSVGAARDFCLGLRFVNGWGQAISNGGRVMKNVTGLDLVKLTCGAMGMLGIITQVTFKVSPAPRHTLSLAMDDLDAAGAIEAMTLAMATPFEVAAAGFRPDGVAGRMVLRLEGFEKSIDYRFRALAGALARFGTAHRLGPAAATTFWTGLSSPTDPASQQQSLWRISLPAGKAVAALAPLLDMAGVAFTLDWAGGLAWVSMAEDHEAMALPHAIAARSGGTATLIRASMAYRGTRPVYQPQSAAVLGLTARVKASMDPDGIFNPERMYEGI